MDETSSIKQLEEILDSKNPTELSTESSKLVGWSPHVSAADSAGLGDEMEDLSLGASAVPAPADSGKAQKPPSGKGGKQEGEEGQRGPPFPKKAKLSKAERRALQEKQRADKAARGGKKFDKKDQDGDKKGGGAGGKAGGGGAQSSTKTAAKPPPASGGAKKEGAQRQRTALPPSAQKQVPLFSHLPQYESEGSLSRNVGFSKNEIHPAFIALGLKYEAGIIRGANARCVAMLTAFKTVIADYSTPPAKMLSWDLGRRLIPLIEFIERCRPKAQSMANAIRYLKLAISKVPPEMKEEDAKAMLQDKIDTYVQERITFADDVIVEYAMSKIADGDVILTYARSHVVEQLIDTAHQKGRKFRLVIVDSRPLLEGRNLQRRLARRGITCTYILVNAISYMMKEVTKVFLGASHIFSNGAVVSRVGTAIVAMTAKAYGVPVMVCCETYKFCERVQIDSICSNELGDPDDMVSVGQGATRCDILSDWRDIASLKLLNLLYDLTPIEYVDMIITEIGPVPPTSVPVLIREQSKAAEMQR